MCRFEKTLFADSLGNHIFQKNLKMFRVKTNFSNLFLSSIYFAWEAALANKSMSERQKQMFTWKKLALQFSGPSMAGWTLGLYHCLPLMAVECKAIMYDDRAFLKRDAWFNAVCFPRGVYRTLWFYNINGRICGETAMRKETQYLAVIVTTNIFAVC